MCGEEQVDLQYLRQKLGAIRARLNYVEFDYSRKITDGYIQDILKYLDVLENRNSVKRLHCQNCLVEFRANTTWHFIGGREYCNMCYEDVLIEERIISE